MVALTVELKAVAMVAKRVEWMADSMVGKRVGLTAALLDDSKARKEVPLVV